MILLATNVLSELMRPAPSPAVESWIGAQPAAAVFAASRGASLATRNVTNFVGCGIETIDPWQGGRP